MDLQIELVEEICDLTHGLQTDELCGEWKAPRGVRLLQDGTGTLPFEIAVQQLTEDTANRLIAKLRRVLGKFLKVVASKLSQLRPSTNGYTEWINIQKQGKSVLKNLKGKTFQVLMTNARKTIEKLKRLKLALWP